MRHLPIPTGGNGLEYAAGEVFRICADSIQKPHELIDRINGIVPEVENAENQYGQLATAATLYTFPRANQVNGAGGTVTADELKRLYDYRLRDNGQPGRCIYDRLLMSSSGICPLCGVGSVWTLDHHLPQAHYPILSVTPNNLVPACRDCQSAKMQDFPRTADEQTLHPYYDNVEADIWLAAQVNQGTPATFTFAVTPPQRWSQTLTNRVRNHLGTFNLPQLFAVSAAAELTDIRHYLRTLSDNGGTNAVRGHLQLQTASVLLVRLNSWKAAMYRAAAQSDWFCDGGFAEE